MSATPPSPTPFSPEVRSARRTIFASTWLVYAGLYFCRKAFYAVKPALLEEQVFDLAQIGDMGLAYLVAYTLGQWLSAAIGRKIGGRVLLLTGMGASLGANLMFGLSDVYATFMLFMIVNGFAQATGWPGCIGILARWTVRTERGLVLGVWTTCYQLGSVAGTSWAAFWMVKNGWRASFFMATLVLLLVWLINLVWLSNSPADKGLPDLEDDVGPLTESQEAAAGEEEEEPKSVWTRDLMTTVALLGLFYVGLKFIRYALWSWAPVLLWTEFGIKKADAAYLSTTFDVAGFLGVIFAGYLSDKVFKGRRATISFLMLLGMVVGCGFLALIGTTHVVAFALSLGLIGFMLFGPDSLITGAGAMDLGQGKVAFAAAGIINGMGSIGSVLQEVVVSRMLREGAGTGSVLVMLLGASGLSVFALGVVLWRNRRGVSDV